MALIRAEVGARRRPGLGALLRELLRIEVSIMVAGWITGNTAGNRDARSDLVGHGWIGTRGY